MTSTPKLYDVVLHKSGEVLATGLTKEAAEQFCREWNSNAISEHWAKYVVHRERSADPVVK